MLNIGLLKYVFGDCFAVKNIFRCVLTTKLTIAPILSVNFVATPYVTGCIWQLVHTSKFLKMEVTPCVRNLSFDLH